MKIFLAMIFLVWGMRAASQHNFDVLHYRYEIEVTDKSDAITGKAVIRIKFLADASEVRFDLQSVEDAKGMYAFQVKENGSLTRHAHINNVIMIVLPHVARKDEVRSYEINYMGTPKDGLIISKNKHGDRTFFADNWPNRAHHWIPCKDMPVDKASFEFHITAPDHYQVVSNGIKIDEKKVDQQRKVTHWKEEIPLSTKVMVIGIARFAIKTFSDSPVSIPVSAWVYPEDSVKGFYDYAVAPSIVKFFTTYFGTFPYRKLANVQSKTIFGGMENAGAIFYAEESVTGDRKSEDVIAHEIVHQWFGDMASEKSFAHLWLSEGFATYFTNVYIRHRYGADSMKARLKSEREKVIRFAKQSRYGVVDSTTDDLMSLLNPNSYEKGAWVLHMLRNELGDSIFQSVVRAYYKRFAGGNADTRDFEVVAENVSGKELTWFFDQWLYRPGVPVLAIKFKHDEDGVKVDIVQKGELYRLVLEIGLRMKDGTYEVRNVLVNERAMEMKWKGKGVKGVVMDPEVKLLYEERN